MKKKPVQKKRPVLRILLIAFGLLLIADTAFAMTRCSIGLGIIMPAILGLPLLAVGLFLPAFRRACSKSRLFRALAFMLSLAYALFGAVFALTTTLILANSSSPSNGADALIVLGGGIRGTGPTLILKYRLDAAKEYLDRNPDTLCIVSGGKGCDEVCSEAEVMRNYLVLRGVDEARIVMEDASLSTEENFIYSKRIIDRRLGTDAGIVFVTTRFHVFRSERVAKRLGIEAEGVPSRGVWYIAPNDYLRECAAIVGYFLTGRI